MNCQRFTRHGAISPSSERPANRTAKTKLRLWTSLPHGIKMKDKTLLQVYMGNLAPDVSADVVEDVMAKFKSMDRVIMKQGTLLCN